jgi:plastocyanin
MMRDSLKRAAPRLAAVALCLPLLLAACSKKADDATTAPANQATAAPQVVNAGPTVAITEFEFAPDPAPVKVGQVVTWRNDGSAKHQVSEDAPAGQPKAFESTLMANGDTYVFTPTKAGTYNYICEIHPAKMKGSLTVTAA